MGNLRNLRTLLAVVVVALASGVLALRLGSVDLGFAVILEALSGGRQEGAAAAIVLELRLPRVLAGFAAGGLLALSGALMQVLLRNPLADPYILGVSGGAACATLAGMLLGLAGVALTLSGIAGALVTTLLVFGLAHGHGAWTPTRLLLTGVVVAAGWGALISLMLSVSSEQHLRGMLFWLLGDLSTPGSPLWGWSVLVAALAVAWSLSRGLNVLARDPRLAASVGENVPRTRVLLYGLTAATTATAVSLAGTIGFVGLVVPHLLRLLGLTDHRVLLPASVLAGGSLVVLADGLARWALAPMQLPVGSLTAIIGVPLFLVLLHRGGGRL